MLVLSFHLEFLNEYNKKRVKDKLWHKEIVISVNWRLKDKTIQVLETKNQDLKNIEMQNKWLFVIWDKEGTTFFWFWEMFIVDLLWQGAPFKNRHKYNFCMNEYHIRSGRRVLLFGPVIYPSHLWELSYHKLLL